MREKKVRMGFETFRDKNNIITEANCKREISVFEFIDSLLKIIHNQKVQDGNAILIDIQESLTDSKGTLNSYK